jgi:glycosyltransferase involved in cell wall biosynthesis
MRWLIVEDALRDRTGHWLEWVTTFHQGFRDLGDEVTVLADAGVQSDIRESLGAVPILPHSIWHRMSDGAGPLTRYSRFVTHAWQTCRILRRYIKTKPAFDAIFVPTVAPHHLLAWYWLIKRTLHRTPTRVLLFFLAAPLRFDVKSGIGYSDGSPSAAMLSYLLRRLTPEVRAGKIILGVETEALKRSMERMTGVTFTLFPQPVKCVSSGESATESGSNVIRMASFGDVRAEKGSEVLQRAILDYRRKFPLSNVRFTMQWIHDFRGKGGGVVSRDPQLLKDSCVSYITRHFADGEYASLLNQTDAMLLPYRVSSYGLRGSRVVIEAVVNAIPVLVTHGTTLAELADKFGASVVVADSDAESLTRGIREIEIQFERLRHKARVRQLEAVRYFSVQNFCSIFRHATTCAGAIKPLDVPSYPLSRAVSPS